jgi:5'-nucleotidase
VEREARPDGGRCRRESQLAPYRDPAARVEVLRVLITNDDGIESPGLSALAGVASERGHDTIVVAPNWDSSGASASVTGVVQGHDLLVEQHGWAGWAPGAVLSMNATPALICRSAFQGAFGPPPDVVLSGINRGANTGRAILHSGTVGAAFTAYYQHRPALAVSLDVTGSIDGAVDGSVDGPVEAGCAYWATAATIAGRLFDWIATEMRHVVLNCNVPNVPIDKVRGIRVGRLAAVGASQTTVTEESGELLPLTVGAATDGVEAPEDAVAASLAPPTDSDLLHKGYACVTAVVPVIEDPSLELATALGPNILGR